ncbi:IclR family transcriptional regulator [Janibacter sp. Soil728]|uniref:IclR family transcriptional regulator n=1 Tax=Janibacter sp. Soil728 TaxID=1736393 RepID=UPI0006FF7193|nr:IclR family transcriptional regulator [Janibacter sp. Soil728]KRE38298.1 IclR family transcriptional regulator [Janibacter sp. Soil728]
MPEVPALRRAVAILRHLSGNNRPVSAGALVRALDLPRSSVYDLLGVLEELALVSRSGGGYLLGAGVSELGSAYVRSDPLRRQAQPIVRDLAEATGGTAQLAVLRGWETVYLVKEQAVSSAAIITATGVRMPAYLTATGRAIMSRMERREVLALLSAEDGFVSRTGVGPRTHRELAELLRLTRLDGHAIERGEISPHIWTVAAPVVDPLDRPVAAIGLSDTMDGGEAPDPARVATAARTVRRAADAVTARLRA